MDINVDKADPEANSLKVSRNLPEGTIEIKLNIEMTFPSIEPADLYAMMASEQERSTWDDRYPIFE